MSDIIDQNVLPSSPPHPPSPLKTVTSINRPRLISPSSPHSPNLPKPDTPPPLPPSPILSRPQKTVADVSRVSDAFRSCYGLVSTLVDEKGHPGVETLFSFTTQVIYIVETTVQSSGSEKKQLVLDLVTATVHDFVRDTDQDDILRLIHNVVPYCIDTVISVAKGEIDIGKQAMQLIQVTQGCLSCLSRPKNST